MTTQSNFDIKQAVKNIRAFTEKGDLKGMKQEALKIDYQALLVDEKFREVEFITDMFVGLFTRHTKHFDSAALLEQFIIGLFPFLSKPAFTEKSENAKLVTISLLSLSLKRLGSIDVDALSLIFHDLVQFQEALLTAWSFFLQSRKLTFAKATAVRIPFLPTACEKLAFPATLIEVPNFAICCSLQYCASVLVRDCLLAYSSLAESNARLFTVATSQITRGDKSVKKVSLEIINEILKQISVAPQIFQGIYTTAEAILKLGYLQHVWPETRDEQFDNIFAKTLKLLSKPQYLELVAADLAESLFETVALVISWNLANSKSKALKTVLCKILFEKVTILSRIRSAVGLLPFFKSQDVGAHVMEIVQHVMRLFACPKEDKKRSRHEAMEDKEESSERPEKRRRTGRTESVSVSNNLGETDDIHNELNEFFGSAFNINSIAYDHIVCELFTEVMTKVSRLMLTKVQDVSEEEFETNFIFLCRFISLLIPFGVQCAPKLYESAMEYLKVIAKDPSPNVEKAIASLFSTHSTFKLSKLSKDVLDTFYSVATSCANNATVKSLRTYSLALVAKMPRSYDPDKRLSYLLDIIKTSSDYSFKSAALKLFPLFIKVSGEKYFKELLTTLRTSHSSFPHSFQIQVLRFVPVLIKLDGSISMSEYQFILSPFFANSNDAKFALNMVRYALPAILETCTLEDVTKFKQQFMKIAELYNHDSADVKLQFATCIPLLLRNNGEIIKTLYDKQTIEEYVSNIAKSSLTAESTLRILGEIGACSEEHQVVKQVVFMLISHLGSHQFHIKSRTYLEIRYIAARKEVTIAELFLEFSETLFSDWFSKAAREERNIGMISSVAAVMDMELSRFVTEAMKFLLPNIIKARNIEDIEKFANVGKVKVTSILREQGYLEYLVSSLFLICTNETECKEAIEFLTKLCDNTEITAAKIVIESATKVVKQLCIDGGRTQDKQKIYSSFKLIEKVYALYVKSDRRSGAPTTLYDMLETTSIEIIEAISNHQELQDTEKFKSLEIFIELLGNKVETCCLKLKEIFKEALAFSNLTATVVDCYLSLVRALSVDEKQKIFGDVLVHLLPYVNSETPDVQNKIARVFSYLLSDEKLVNNNKEMLALLPKLPPKMENINELISKHKGKISFEQVLQNVTVALDHNSIAVKQLALTHLKNFLRTERKHYIYSLIADDIDVSRLVEKLLASCQNERLRILCGECLGLITAIEASRLSINPQADERQELGDSDLARHIINLAYTFLTSSLGMHSEAAYTLQEAAKIACTIDGENWCRGLSEEVVIKAKSYLNTKYETTVKETSSIVVYDGENSQKTWMKYWLKQLIRKCSTSTRSKLFMASYSLIRTQVNAAIQLLPYLVQNVILFEGEKDREEIRAEMMKVLEYESKKEKHTSNAVTQAIFSLLDTFSYWVEQKRKAAAKSLTQKGEKAKPEKMNDKEIMEKFVDSIPKDILAKAAFNNRAYARALMYLETFMRNQRVNTKSYQPAKEHLKFLQTIYSKLDDPDGISGVASMRTVTTIEEQIVDHETNGNWTEALSCYELALQTSNDKDNLNSSVSDCFKNLGQLRIMLTLVDGMGDNPQAVLSGIQGAWRLCEWGLLEEYVKKADERMQDFEVGLSRALLAYRSQDSEQFRSNITTLRLKLVEPLAAASMESYQRSYPYIVQLQMLSELEESFCLFENSSENQSAKNFIEITDYSFRTMQQVVRIRDYEPLLSLRRVIYNIHNLKYEASKTWLHWTKLARRVGHFETASLAVLQASVNPPPTLQIEKAKVLWQKGEHVQAIAALSNPNIDLGNAKGKESSQTTQFLKAKMSLMSINWKQYLRQKNAEEAMIEYEKVVQEAEVWEHSHFYYASFIDTYSDAKLVELDRRIEKYKQAQQPEIVTKLLESKIQIINDLILKAVNGYGKSLLYGDKHLYHSLPRMLTLWFNVGKQLNETKTKQDIIGNYNNKILQYGENLPTYQWYTALSQLSSRVTHPHPQVVEVVQKLIGRVIVCFPAQSLWSIACTFNSTDSSRKLVGRKILEEAKKALEAKKRSSEISRMADLFNQLIMLADVDPGQTSKMQLPTKFENYKNCNILIPLQSSMTITLPKREQNTVALDFNPFPSTAPLLKNFESDVTVMGSLQKPKKIGVMATDGSKHNFLCKPKDDLRKDARMMEFFSMMNRLFKKDPESKKRRLIIRTFSVITLSEAAGLVEWVQDTVLLRGALTSMYSAMGINAAPREVIRKHEAMQDQKKIHDPVHRKARIENFKSLVGIGNEFPPVFSKWFLTEFQEPTRWLKSRDNYVKTVAVMSMVGYIVGLGDRHGENILFDSRTGECVQIDFGCLFDKGKELRVPECVPFRLTHNMVDACGIYGYEGPFRKVCEVTLSLLREKKETVMSVLDTFVHDPLVDWMTPGKHQQTKEKSRKSSPSKHELAGQQAAQCMNNISKRLKGIVSDQDTWTVDGTNVLGVQGQVDALINQATNPDNLSRMFYGWMPWL